MPKRPSTPVRPPVQSPTAAAHAPHSAPKAPAKNWEAVAQEYLAGWQRAKADFENLQKRVAQERGAWTDAATEQVLHDLLPIVDNFAAAFATVPADAKETAWLTGFQYIAKQLEKFLADHGVTPLAAVGQPFDPTQHEAIEHVPGPAGTVVTEVRRGYRFRDRMLRPAGVTVGNGQ